MTAATDLGEAVVAGLRAAIRGEVITPNDAGYDEARAVWNGMIDRAPALIVRCTDESDVITAVGFARAHDLLLAVRGGGHSAAGLAVCDGGIVIDLSRMKGIAVDPVRRTVRAQGGVTWGELDRETQTFGLATTGGAISTTGIAGLTLGGGLGWLMRSHGLACDNLLSVEMVTADGRLLTVSEHEHADLLWGVRGGGGNFGIVTSFEFRLHPVETVLAGMLVHPLERAGEVLRFYRDFTRSAPDELTVFASLMTTPEGVPVLALVVCYNGPVVAGEEALRPLRSFGPPIADQIAPMPYTQLQSMLDEAFPHGLQVYWRSHFLSGLEDTAVDAIVARIASVSSPLTAVLIEQLGGAVSRVGHDATAFQHRSARFNLAIITRWTDPAGSAPHIAWTRDLWDALRPFASGVYVNYLGVEEGQDRVHDAYGATTYERLTRLKAQYDPTNLFRLNQNITPS